MAPKNVKNHAKQEIKYPIIHSLSLPNEIIINDKECLYRAFNITVSIQFVFNYSL